MRILGIDPGLQRAGWGVIDVEGNRLKHLAHGVVRTDAKATLAERLHHIFDSISVEIIRFKPTTAAVEETFMNNNPAAALKLGQARGAAMLAPAKAGLQVFEYPANLIKKSVVGAGHADKDQVKAMIKILLSGVEASSDAADALAVAICHAHHHATRALVGGIMSGGVR